MKKLLVLLVAIAILLFVTGIARAQFTVTCPGGTVVATPTASGGVTLVCVAYTPTPTNTPTATATFTPLPTATPIPPTATHTPVAPTATPTPNNAPVVAFPGAEGFGAQAVGGRGGAVIEVTNLNDSGTGSLRACIQATGPRTCVFRTGGTIVLNSPLIVTNPFLTIAGQSAPGDGITLRSATSTQESGLQIKTKEVIVRYLRFRPGTVLQDLHILSVNAGATATGTAAAHNIIFDHVSVSWGGDEMLILYGNSHHITVQWSSISESLPAPASGSVAVKGIILGADNATGLYSLHHNLLAHNHQRNPNIDVDGIVDFTNNVVYNWNFSGTNLKNGPEVNLVGNYVKPGPNTASNGAFVKLTSFTGSYYLNGNMVDGQIKTVPFAPGAGVSTRFAAPAVSTQSAAFAYDMVLSLAGNSQGLDCDGSWIARRDSVDERIVQSVIDGTRGHNIAPASTYNQLGYISTPNDVGGWPTLAAGTPCPDSDHDGMPDTYEAAHGFNPNVVDSATIMADGYSRLEHYLNGMN